MGNSHRTPRGTKKSSENSEISDFDDLQGDLHGGAPEDGVKVLKLSEALKKIVTAGVGAAFMTEEHIRAQLSELKLPKEAMNMILANASKSKEELVKRIGNEAVKMISRIDFVKEASRFVEEHKFRIQAEVEVIKKESPGSQREGSDSSETEV